MPCSARVVVITLDELQELMVMRVVLEELVDPAICVLISNEFSVLPYMYAAMVYGIQTSSVLCKICSISAVT